VDGEDPFENRLFKALPHFGVDKEYRDLAIAISRDILTRNPGVTWNSIVGLDNAKALLKEAVVMPLKYPQLFTGLLAPWKGVLLFGPPGTGKTLLAKAVATECETTYFNITASTVVSKWRGDSEKLIRVLFDLARHHQPSTIFIDELDSLMGARGGGDGEHEGSRRMKTELLIQLDGLLRDDTGQVFLLAASNLPWDLDSAMLRRLEKRVLVNLPTREAREQMIRASLPDGFADELDYTKLAELTQEWSGSDIRLLCKEAAMHPLRRLMTEIESAELQPQPEKQGRSNSRQRAVEKSAAAAIPPQVELKMGPVTEADVMRALQTVHRAPAAHSEKYLEWQEQFGAA
jgi:katanin p60 ATPase-containing subunit A1